MEKISILNNFDKSKYFLDPYPHLIIDKVFDDKIYEELETDFQRYLINEFQRKKEFLNENTRVQLAASEISKNKNLKSKIWKDFVDYHCSKEFFLEFFKIFENEIYRLLPDVYKKIQQNQSKENFIEMRGGYHKSRTELAKQNSKCDFVLDCQPSITTPNINGQKSVRGPHVDSPYKLYAGLFYLRNPKDQLEGGDIVLYKPKNKVKFNNKTNVINSNDLEQSKVFKYGINNLVMHLNTPLTVHGVSKRATGNFNRNLVNIIAESYREDKLFNLNYQNNIFANISNKFKKYLNL